MKTVISISFFFLVSINLFAQQTTEEEYNYITKGYKIQIESGLDMKKGYTLKDLGMWALNFNQEGNRQVTFKGLYRDGSLKPCAIMMIYQRPSTSHFDYYCIPSLDAEKDFWDRTLEHLNANYNNPNMKQLYSTLIWALMKFSASESSK